MLLPDARYRFHGRIPPKGGRPPLAFIAPVEGAAEDGVATLRLYDPVDSWGGDWGVSAKEFADALDGLPAGTREIRLHINSPGGEVFEGLAILNVLRRHEARVTTVVDGLAASIASVIAMGGDEVVMARNSELMIHDAWGICMGNAEDMRTLAATLDHLSDNVASAYAGKAGGELAHWRDLMLAETWFSADEAVSAGLADRVESAAPAAENHFDLTTFRYAGRAGAPTPGAAAAAAAADDRLEMRHRLNARRLRVSA